MTLYPKMFTASEAVTTLTTRKGLHIHNVEVVPDGGSLEVRILKGTGTDGTEQFRIKATEDPENRDLRGLEFPYPIYIYFYDGEGAFAITTEEKI